MVFIRTMTVGVCQLEQRFARSASGLDTAPLCPDGAKYLFLGLRPIWDTLCQSHMDIYTLTTYSCSLYPPPLAKTALPQWGSLQSANHLRGKVWGFCWRMRAQLSSRLGEGLWSQMLGTGWSGAAKGEDMCGSWSPLISK